MKSVNQRRGFTLKTLLIVIAVLAIILSVIVNAISRLNMAMHQNYYGRYRIKNLSLAILTYEEAHKIFPPLCFRNDSSPPKFHPIAVDHTLRTRQYSWVTLILPYMEEKSLYDQISQATKTFTIDPDSPNIQVRQINNSGPPVPPHNIDIESLRLNYLNGTRRNHGNTNYIAIPSTTQQLLTMIDSDKTFANGVIIPDGSGVRRREIIDGWSKTILIAETAETERSNWYHWQQTFACGFLPGDTSVAGNDPQQTIPRQDKHSGWMFNTTAGDRTAINFGPTTSNRNHFYSSDKSDPLHRSWGPSNMESRNISTVRHAMADGVVLDISEEVDPKVYYGIITRAGGEPNHLVFE